MHIQRSLRLALPACALTLAVTAAPALAFEPSVLVRSGEPGEHMVVTDLAARGDDLAVSIDRQDGSDRFVGFHWSANGGADWDSEGIGGGGGVRESQVTACAGHAVLIYRSAESDPATSWRIGTFAYPFAGGSGTAFSWTTAGDSRQPDVACVANRELVAAWFQKSGSSSVVKVKTRVVEGTDSSPQSFTLGTGKVNKGLAIATSSTRVYVAWFSGDQLKLTRFSISGASHHDLTRLGTSTIATLPYAYAPEIGADGDRVVIAYSDRADLKVRGSTNRGVSWGSALVVRDEPFPSEQGAYPMNVAFKGSRVAIGAVEIGGIDLPLNGKGLGYLSTNGGASYTKVSMHSGGRTVAGLVKVGSAYRYAEAWDQSVSDPESEVVRYRRQ